MFSPDLETHKALSALIAATKERERPLVIWIGAGASGWAGYPRWQEVAAEMHSDFSKEPAYEKKIASCLLDEAKYPELFEQMRVANQSRYLTALARQFGPRKHNGVYSRMLRALKQITPVNIVTTNVDEALERNAWFCKLRGNNGFFVAGLCINSRKQCLRIQPQ